MALSVWWVLLTTVLGWLVWNPYSKLVAAVCTISDSPFGIANLFELHSMLETKSYTASGAGPGGWKCYQDKATRCDGFWEANADIFTTPNIQWGICLMFGWRIIIRSYK